MTRDEARELFSAAYDGMLPEEERGAFDAMLAGDPELEAEYQELRELLDEAQALSPDEGDPALRALLEEAHELAADEEGDDPVPDLLPGVQDRLRARSGGRFYRDRFSRSAGFRSFLPIFLGVVMLLIVGVSWLMMHHVVVEEPQHGESSDGSP